MNQKRKRNTTPIYPRDGVYLRSVSLANDYRLRLPMPIVDALGLGDVATLTVRMNAEGQVILEAK